MKKQNLFLLMTILLFVISCFHVQDAIPPDVETSPTSFLSLATVNNGRLYFKNVNDAQLYYESISKLIQASDNSDSVLLSIEKSHNYLPLRTHHSQLRTEDDTLIEQSTAEILAEIRADFIKDDIRLSILNQYYEVGIGDYVYVFFSESQIYRIESSNTDAINDFRAEDKGEEEIPYHLIRNGVILESGIMSLYKNQQTFETPNVVIGIRSNSCEGNEKVMDFVAKMDGSTVSSPVTYTVNWGDGTPAQTISSAAGPSFGNGHTYPNPWAVQTYNGSVTADFASLTMQPISVTTNFTVTTLDCVALTGDDGGIIEGNKRAMKWEV